jgi:chemotaxis protein MotB
MSFEYRRRRRMEDQHVDDWLMTYADMITLLLCFFAIFLAVSVPKQDQMKQAAKQMQEQFAKTGSKANESEDQFPPHPTLVPKTSDAIFDRMPSIIDQFEGAKNMKIKQGDRVTTIDMNSAPLFSSGSADVSEAGGQTLMNVLKIVNSEQYRDYRVTVEGYTDDIPINTPEFPSNWELSTARASAVVRFMIGHGVDPQRLRAEGFADVAPKAPNRDTNGRPIPENQAQNRRVVVKLEKIDPDKSDDE